MAPPASFTVDAADFDGTNDSIKNGAALSGVVDSKLGTFCAWVRLDGGDGANRSIFSGVTTLGGTTTRFSLVRGSSNLFRLIGLDGAGGAALNIATVNTYVAGATWRWIAASWDMADAAKRHLYVGDVSDLAVTSFVNAAIDYTLPDWGVGAATSLSGRFDGCLAELFFFPGAYIDLSVQANRRLFYSAAGKPVDPATAIATLGAPAIYMHLNDGETANNFAANDDGGTGGTFTVTGTLDTASTSPSD